ncbi:MAG: hypothetical protein GY950_33630 [bacterium]|nr:hypothetical protein [bacterium]
MIDTQTEDKRLEIMYEAIDSQQSILAPGVGYYMDRPSNGAFLVGGSSAGKLKTLTATYNLYLPDDIYGQVWVEESKDFMIPVEYGQELFRINPEKTLFKKQMRVTDIAAGLKDIDADTPDEGYVVKAFTTGIFYAKPSPDSPPFVSPGQEIEKGKALGLIEVMKTFNHIIFQGTDDYDTGKIKKVYVKDAQEVKLGQPLFLIE